MNRPENGENNFLIRNNIRWAKKNLLNKEELFFQLLCSIITEILLYKMVSEKAMKPHVTFFKVLRT